MKNMLHAMVVAGLLLGGCTYFPYGTSIDKHNFISSPLAPVTLTLVDSVTKETVWKLDVPVGMMAVVNFDRDVNWIPGQDSAMPATLINWDIVKPETRLHSLKNKQELSGNPIYLKCTIRDVTAAAPQPAKPAPAVEQPKAQQPARGEPVAPAPAEQPSATITTPAATTTPQPQTTAK